MIELGIIQELKVSHMAPVGAYLAELDATDKENTVLLPNKEVPEGLEVGTVLSVFIYRDSEDRLTASLIKPEIELGQVKNLEVADVTNIGAFLKWGLTKDLLLPYSEQLTEVKVGKKYLVALYIDKSNRLCATMKFSKHLKLKAPFKQNDIVDCLVYDVNEQLGAFVVIDNKYDGLVLKNALVQRVKVGDVLEARVARIRADGRLDLTQLPPVKQRMDDDSAKIWEILGDHAGRMPFNDKTDPEVIKSEFGMSKRAFKRAVGQLLKNGKIVITDEGIEMK